MIKPRRTRAALKNLSSPEWGVPSLTLRFHCHHCNIPVGSCPICFTVSSLEVPTTTCENNLESSQACLTHTYILDPFLTILAPSSSRTLISIHCRPTLRHERRTLPERSQNQNEPSTLHQRPLAPAHCFLNGRQRSRRGRVDHLRHPELHGSQESRHVS